MALTVFATDLDEPKAAYEEAKQELITKLKSIGAIDQNKKYLPSGYELLQTGFLTSFIKNPDYAYFTFSGTLSEKLSDLTAFQCSMIAAFGHSLFSGTCSLNGLKFSGRIYTD